MSRNGDPTVSEIQKVTDAPKVLLRRAGFRVKEPAEGHLCCGSAGVYNIVQPEIAGKLRERKLGNISRTEPDLIAAGNIGCLTQLGSGSLPAVHTVELLDWMAGGPRPKAAEAIKINMRGSSLNKFETTKSLSISSEGQ